MICIAIMVAVGEVRPAFPQVAGGNRRFAHRADGLGAGRSAIDQDESHVCLRIGLLWTMQTLQDESHVCLRIGLLWTMQTLSGRARPRQPFAIGLPARFEPIDAPAGTQGSSPGVVPFEPKSPVTDRATLDGTVTKLFGVAAHCCLLFVSRGSRGLVRRSLSLLVRRPARLMARLGGRNYCLNRTRGVFGI